MNMNNKAFTLVELLATIVIIAIVMGIVLPSAIKISEDNQNRMFEEYKKIVEEYALVSPLKGQESIPLASLDVPENLKRECTGYAALSNLDPIEYTAHIECNNS